MFSFGNLLVTLLLYQVYRTESNHAYQTESNQELCNVSIETIEQFDRNFNISSIEKCLLCTNKNIGCFEKGDYSELFDKIEKDYFTHLSIDATSRGKEFCYFCISEYNSSTQTFTFDQRMQSNDTFDDIVKIRYGDDSQTIGSVFKKWNTKLNSKRRSEKKYVLKTVLGKKQFIAYSCFTYCTVLRLEQMSDAQSLIFEVLYFYLDTTIAIYHSAIYLLLLLDPRNIKYSSCYICYYSLHSITQLENNIQQ